MNLDLTDSPSRTQKSTTQKKSYKPRKSNTKNTRKSNFSIHFPPPKASHKLSSKKKKKVVTNLFLSQKSFELLLHRCKPERSPMPTILVTISGEFSCAYSTVFFIFFPN